MAPVTSASRAVSGALAWTWPLAHAGRGFADFMAIIAAAGRAASAIEARRQPANGDLRVLGVQGPVPSSW